MLKIAIYREYKCSLLKMHRDELKHQIKIDNFFLHTFKQPVVNSGVPIVIDCISAF